MYYDRNKKNIVKGVVKQTANYSLVKQYSETKKRDSNLAT